MLWGLKFPLLPTLEGDAGVATTANAAAAVLEFRRDMEYHGPIRNRLHVMLKKHYRRRPLLIAIALAIPGYMTVLLVSSYANPNFSDNFALVLLEMACGAAAGALLGVAGASLLRNWLIPQLRPQVRGNLAGHLLLVRLLDDHGNKYWRATAGGLLRFTAIQTALREPAGTLRRLVALVEYYALFCRTEPRLQAWPPVVRRLERTLLVGFAIAMVPIILTVARPFTGTLLGPMQFIGRDYWFTFFILYEWLFFGLLSGYSILTAIQKQAVVETLIAIIDSDE